MKMHTDQLAIDSALASRLLANQFPRWSGLPLQRVDSTGTVNAIYRLGEDLSVRLPLSALHAKALEHEISWLPRLATHLPMTIPEVVAVGEPSEEYPVPWAVMTWIDGSSPVPGEIDDQGGWADGIAGFVHALRQIDTADGPRVSYRGRPLAERDRDTRIAISEVTDEFDNSRLSAIWDSFVALAPTDDEAWFHGDLHSTNLIGREGRPVGVIDFGGCAVGDPSSDLIPAWWIFDTVGRDRFRHAIGVDDSAWERGRGWALSIALVALPYYRETNPRFADHARYAIRQVLDDQPRRSSRAR